MQKYNYFFLDRDGVILTNGIVNEPSDLKFIDGALEFIDGALKAFRLLTLTGCESYITTNEHVEAGYVTKKTLLLIHMEMCRKIGEVGQLNGVFYCRHKDPCRCRKPKPGLIERAMKRNKLLHKKKDCCLIGDYITDWQAAEAAGIQPIAVKTGRYSEPEVAKYVTEHNIPLYPDMLAAVEALADPVRCGGRI